MATLQTIDLLDNDKYLKAIEKFTFPDWRVFFYIPNERERTWLDWL